MTFGGPLDSFRIGAGGQKNHVFTVLGFSVPPGPPGRQEGLAKCLINHTYVKEPSDKLLKDGIWRASELLNTFDLLGGCHAQRNHGRFVSLSPYLPCPVHIFNLVVPELYP